MKKVVTKCDCGNCPRWDGGDYCALEEDGRCISMYEVVMDLKEVNDMEEVKKLAIPDGYEFDKVDDGEVILKKKEVVVLPKMWNECLKGRGMCYYPGINWYVPNENENALRALCKLLICRNAWWTQLGWKPDWENDDNDKYCISNNGGDIDTFVFNASNRILAFPNLETAKQFREAFKELIEEAKELL